MKHKKGALTLGACLFLAFLCSTNLQSATPTRNFNFSDYFSPGDSENKSGDKPGDTSSNWHKNHDAENYVPEDKKHIQLAEKYKKNKQPDLAIMHYKKALEINPNNFKIQFDLANILYINSRFDEAIEAFDQAEQIFPKCAQLYFNKSLCHMQKKETNKTIECLKKAIEIDPEYEKAYNQLGVLLHKNKKDHEAVKYLTQAAQKNPDSFNAIFLLAKSTRNTDNLEKAENLFRKALQVRPDSTMVMVELANTLNMSNKTQEALELYKKALDNNPNQPSIRYNYAYTLKKLGHVAESIGVYHQVLKEQPDYAQAHFSLALAYLVLGNFEQGWKEYEWRWEAYRETKKSFDQPEWDGSDPTGLTILLCAEQGLGDTFQFVRYAKILKNMGATVIVQTQRPLTSILELCEYIDVVVPRGKPLPHFDCFAHLMSLPLIFNTTVDTVPDLVPYLNADPKLVEYWRKKLAQDKNFKVGICWQGNKGYRTQALKHAVAAKSMHAQLFKPLAELPGVSLYCLQKVNGEEQLKEIDFDIHTFGPDFDNSHGRFMDSAAIVKNLDLVITVDTSICHFAAALGTPVWTILPLPADWRWMLETSKTPWYGNMRLFRQKEVDAWEEIMQEIVQELCSVLGIPYPQQQQQDNADDILYEYDPTQYESQTPQASQKTKKLTPHKQSHKNSNKQDKAYKPKNIADKPLQKQSSNNFNISFKDMDNMQFQEVLDLLIILKIKYDDTQDKHIEKELKQIEQQLRNLSHIYNTNSEKLDELSEKLYDINSQLASIDKQIAQLEDTSVFNKEFNALTKQAQYINNLKYYVKNEIKEVVKPQ